VQKRLLSGFLLVSLPTRNLDLRHALDPDMPPPSAAAPKKPMSAFMIFVSEKRAEFQAQNAGLSIVELTKAMGEAWKNMSDSDRTYWIQKADADRQRYDAEVAAQGPGAVPGAKQPAQPAFALPLKPPVQQPIQKPNKGPTKSNQKLQKGPVERKKRVQGILGKSYLINKSRMLQLAARAGVSRLSGLTYMELNDVYKKKLSEILGRASALAEHKKSRTIKVEDVVAAFALSGVQIFGA
jgi:histone H3/H4